MKWSVKQLVPSVRPISAEPLRFIVRSRTEPGTEYLVDLACHHGNGKCTCFSFAYRLNPQLKEGLKPGEASECWHIKQANRYLAYQVKHQIIEQQLAAENANRKRAGKKPVRYEPEGI